MCIHPIASGNGAMSLRHRAGFTLLEVIAGMALIMFVIGGVYGIANGAISLGTSMNVARIAETRLTNFSSVWRDYFENLPPGIRFTGGADKVARGGRGSLLIEGGDIPFAWTPAVRLAEAVEFSVVRGENRDFDLVVRHLKKPERPISPDDYKVLAQLPLLQGLKSISWGYFDATEKKWFNSWDPKKRPTPPLFMRMKFQFTEDPREHEFVFWIANDLAVVGDPAAAPPAADPANMNPPPQGN